MERRAFLVGGVAAAGAALLPGVKRTPVTLGVVWGDDPRPLMVDGELFVHAEGHAHLEGFLKVAAVSDGEADVWADIPIVAVKRALREPVRAGIQEATSGRIANSDGNSWFLEMTLTRDLTKLWLCFAEPHTRTPWAVSLPLAAVCYALRQA